MNVGDLGGVAGQLSRRTFERAVRGLRADGKFDGLAGLSASGEDDLNAFTLVDLDRLRGAVGGQQFAALGAALTRSP